MTMDPTSTVWTGWDLRGGAAQADHEPPFASSDDATAFELLAVAGRGFRPPRYLTVDDPSHEREAAELGVREVWSLCYRTLVETAPRSVAPHAIYLLGVNPPPDLDDDELATFNDFYSTVHLPEVATRRHALRAVRYELTDVRKPPYNGAPRFLASYEVDEAGAANRRHTGPPYSSGPDVWRRHTTPWRLWYRRLPGTPAS